MNVTNKKNEKKRVSPFAKYLALIILSIGGGTIYIVPYMTSTFRVTFENLGFDATSLGLLMTTYGIICLILYIPGGIFADKFKAKYLFSFSLTTTGIVCLLYMLSVSVGEFWMLVMVQMLFAVTTVLTFWSAFVKAIKTLGTDDEQAKLYGISEGFKGVSTLVASLAVTSIIAASMDKLEWALLFLAVLYMSIGISSFFLLPKEKEEGEFSWKKVKELFTKKKESTKEKKPDEIENAVNFHNIKKTFFNLDVWLIGLTILFWMIAYNIIWTYTTYWYTDGLSPAWNLDSNLTNTLSSVRIYGVAGFSAICVGLITSKWIGSPSKTLIGMGVCSVIVASFFFLVNMLGSDVSVAIPIALTFIIMIFIGGSRGVFWGTVAEVKIPTQLAGIAIGVISIIGFSVDIFLHPLLGTVIDANKDVSGIVSMGAFNIIWGLLVFSLIGGTIVPIVILYRKGKLTQNKNKDIFKEKNKSKVISKKSKSNENEIWQKKMNNDNKFSLNCIKRYSLQKNNYCLELI